MHWELLVPVVVLAVWILSQLFRGPEDAKGPRQPGQPAPPEKPLSEVDQFLAEINRLRRQAAAPRPTPPVDMKDIPEVIPVDPPRPRPVPPPPPPQNRPPQQRPANVRQVNPATLQQARPQQGKQAKPRRIEPPKPVAAPPPPPTISDLPDGPPAVVFFQHTPSPAIMQTLALLRNPKTLPAAFILQEVLGPPRCKRPPGR